MSKTYIKTLRQLMALANLPTSRNVSTMKFPDGEEFDVGDNGQAVDIMISQVQADTLLLSLLQGMNDREKIILMYQVLRESGYNLNHAECAKTLNITRERYMVILKGVKSRAAKILQFTMR